MPCAHGSDTGLPGVDSNTHLKVGDPPGRGNLQSVGLHLPDDLQRGERRPVRVVIPSDRHTEVRGDAIARVRLHHPAALLDRTTHAAHAVPDQHLHLVRLHSFAQ